MISPSFHENLNLETFQFRHKKFSELIPQDSIVLDIGAHVGSFSIVFGSCVPKGKVLAFEPSYEEFKTLVLNTRHGNVTHINKGISDKVGEFDFGFVFEKTENQKLYSTTFKKVIEDYNIQKIDFLKTDCETGEYDIFTIENLFWIKNNVRKISGEWHLGEDWMKEKFKTFRDVYLRVFPNFKILSFDGIDITWQVWNDEFIPYYREIMIFIDNRS